MRRAQTRGKKLMDAPKPPLNNQVLTKIKTPETPPTQFPHEQYVDHLHDTTSPIFKNFS